MKSITNINTLELNFKHSGRLGDIVYALPLVKKIVEIRGLSANFYILNDHQIDVKKSAYHPGMGLKVNRSLFDYIAPLLMAQPYIQRVIYCATQQLPKEFIDLDSFNFMGLNLMASGNQVWYRKAFGIPVPIEKQWIELDDHRSVGTPASRVYDILVNKSTRFYNEKINYGFLNEFEHVGFVGLDIEFNDFKKRHQLSHIQHVPTKSALEFAKLMNCAGMFLGNQSLGFAIAEGLKVARAVEVYEPVPVVIPIGGYCIEYVNTHQVQSFVEQFFQKSLGKTFHDYPGSFVESILNPKKIKFKRRILKTLGFKRYQSF
jgi:hypothetical protein